MNTRFSKTILVLAAAGLLIAGSAYAGNGMGAGMGTGTGVCDGTGDGTCTADGIGNGIGNGDGQHGPGGPADRMAGMANRLGLTLEQQIQALEMFNLHAQDREAIQARIFEDYGSEICAQRELHRSEFQALLTPEQLALHEELMLQRAERRGGMGFGGFECPTDGN